MAIPAAAVQLADIARRRAVRWWDGISCAGSEHVARWSGRAAAWADERGEAIADLIERAVGHADGLSHTAAEAAGWQAERLGGHLAAKVRVWAEELGDGVVHLGQDLITPRGVERAGPGASSPPSTADVHR